MKSISRIILTCLFLPKLALAQAPPFPPLQAPAEFSTTLFARDPRIEYPSVIALGPRKNTLFVANDYVKGLGRDIERRDDIRLLEDVDGDGVCDRSVVFAEGFNSIQGLEHLDGALYVMHAPQLTMLRDADQDGKADQRRDLLDGLGLPPEKNPSRLHCANGVVGGYDGWLYLALGDNGCDVKRPEGDRLVFHGGGILRCRPDGRDLHTFATGLRNIYDIALDEQLNVFVRDNENDGGDYMVRIYHSFFGADHGYPYLYRDRPQEALGPLADLGRGSAAGGVIYRETQFPVNYRGQLFFCEWGRAVVHCDLRRAGAGFAPTSERDFAYGLPQDPYGFKPTDIVVSRDGSMFVSDWADGQSTGRGRGRIYRIRAKRNRARGNHQAPESPIKTIEQAISQLDSPGYLERHDAQLYLQKQGAAAIDKVWNALENRRFTPAGECHAVWIITPSADDSALERLFKLLRQNHSSGAKVQAVRAIADAADPVLVEHRLAASQGDAAVARRLAEAALGQPKAVLIEIVIALGRLRWSSAPKWLAANIAQADHALMHAAMQTLRRVNNWPAVLKLLDRPSDALFRTLALRAVAEQTNPAVVEGLLDRLKNELRRSDGWRRAGQYADLLSRVWKKPGPWKYWGYRPAPRPANIVAWKKTKAIQDSLNTALEKLTEEGSLALLARMKREQIPTRLTTLRSRLQQTKSPRAIAALLEALGDHPAKTIQTDLREIILKRTYSEANRLTALSMLFRGDKANGGSHLVPLAKQIEDGSVLASTLRLLAESPRSGTGKLDIVPFLKSKFNSSDPQVRAAAVGALGRHGAYNDGAALTPLLGDRQATVRTAAAKALSVLLYKPAARRLRQMVNSGKGDFQAACFGALKSLGDSGVIKEGIQALDDPQVELAALEYLCAVGDADLASTLVEFVKRRPSRQILSQAIRALSRWDAEKSIAQVQGFSGELLHWKVSFPRSQALPGNALPARLPPRFDAKTVFASALSQVTIRTTKSKPPHTHLASTMLNFPKPISVRFHISSREAATVWLGDAKVFQQSTGGASLRTDAFDAKLPAGATRVLVRIDSPRNTSSFQLRFREKASAAHHERLAQLALKQKGNAENGRRLLLDIKKTQCLKCHQLDNHGQKIGPVLTGVGARFSRIHLVESILQPSRHVAAAYRTVTVVLHDGKVAAGVIVDRSPEALTLADREGKRHVFPLTDIVEQTIQETSTMPEGLEKQLTAAEFVDLIDFLTASRSQVPPGNALPARLPPRPN